MWSVEPGRCTECGCVGGVTGIILAYGLCRFLAEAAGVRFLFDPNINLISFAFSAAA